MNSSLSPQVERNAHIIFEAANGDASKAAYGLKVVDGNLQRMGWFDHAVMWFENKLFDRDVYTETAKAVCDVIATTLQAIESHVGEVGTRVVEQNLGKSSGNEKRLPILRELCVLKNNSLSDIERFDVLASKVQLTVAHELRALGVKNLDVKAVDDASQKLALQFNKIETSGVLSGLWDLTGEMQKSFDILMYGSDPDFTESISSLEEKLKVNINDHVSFAHLTRLLISARQGSIKEILVPLVVKAISDNPRDPFFQTLGAEINFRSVRAEDTSLENHWDGPEKYFREVLDLEPNNAFALARLGNVLTQQAWYHRNTEKGTAYLDEATKHLERAVELEPDYALPRKELGNLLVRQERGPEAEAHFKKFVELKPNDAEVRLTLGRILLQRNALGEAEVHFKKRVELEPDYGVGHRYLGEVLYRQGREAEAELHLRKAEGFTWAHVFLGNILSKQEGKAEEAAENFVKAGKSFVRDQEYQKAYECLTAAVNLSPNNVDALVSLGALLRSYKESADDAIGYLKRAIEHDSTNARAWMILGDVYALNRNMPEAAKCFEEAVKIEPKHEDAYKLKRAQELISSGEQWKSWGYTK